MRLNRLYTKFFLSFLVVLVIAEVLVLILFVVVPMRHFGARLENLARNKAEIVKSIVEYKIESAPDVGWSKNTGLKQFIADFAQILDAKIWIVDTTGEVAVKSFSGAVPNVTGEVMEGFSDHQNFRVLWLGHFGYYHVVIPVDVSGKRAGAVHVLVEKRPLPPPRRYLLLGFLVLALTIALLIIPVSRLMTTRLKRLTQSAIRITEGDLSHRARVAGNDEISELSRAFNRMTEKLESMIVSGRELTANVSHELRSPLTRIRLAEEMLREKSSDLKEDAWAGGHLDAIREEVAELDDLIGRALELSKLNLRETPLKFDPLDPSETVAAVMEKLRPAAERKGLRLAVEAAYDPPFVGDREALRSVFSNVLENAVKFAPDGGEISVSMHWQPKSLEVVIFNTFDGLSEEDLVRIFDPFERVKRHTAAGYGLGLTIARKIIERHGGTINARNAEKGLEIVISLPRGEGR